MPGNEIHAKNKDFKILFTMPLLGGTKVQLLKGPFKFLTLCKGPLEKNTKKFPVKKLTLHDL